MFFAGARKEIFDAISAKTALVCYVNGVWYDNNAFIFQIAKFAVKIFYWYLLIFSTSILGYLIIGLLRRQGKAYASDQLRIDHFKIIIN